MKKDMKWKMVKWMAIAIILSGIGLVVSWFVEGDTEWTDDAQVEQYVSPIMARVPGYIREVRFTEHQEVRKGDTLLLIDDREMRIGKLKNDYKRFKALLEKKATTPMVVEQYQTELEAAQMKLEALRRQRAAALSTVGEVQQRQENAEAAIMRAEAAVDMARLNLSYTVITASCDGWLGRRNIQEGQLVSPGMQLTTIVPSTSKWVVANFKETQLARIREGQPVELRVDAMPDRVFQGKVGNISSATGARYSVIPTDNSTGNFVKIQQRVPVRILFEDLTETENRSLAAGMMCEVKVDVR